MVEFNKKVAHISGKMWEDMGFSDKLGNYHGNLSCTRMFCPGNLFWPCFNIPKCLGDLVVLAPVDKATRHMVVSCPIGWQVCCRQLVVDNPLVKAIGGSEELRASDRFKHILEEFADIPVQFPIKPDHWGKLDVWPQKHSLELKIRPLRNYYHHCLGFPTNLWEDLFLQCWELR